MTGVQTCALPIFGGVLVIALAMLAQHGRVPEIAGPDIVAKRHHRIELGLGRGGVADGASRRNRATHAPIVSPLIGPFFVVVVLYRRARCSFLEGNAYG